jgi:SAM-dependent methyltransferase
MNKIDVKKIMSEVEEDIYRKQQLRGYKESLKKLTELARKHFKDSDLYDLKMRSSYVKKVNLPTSVRGGTFAKLSNKLILKLYFLLTKMLNDSSIMQHKVNNRLIDEVMELKSKIQLLDTKHFPYMHFLEKYKKSEKDLNEFAELILSENLTKGHAFITNVTDTYIPEKLVAGGFENIRVVINDSIDDTNIQPKPGIKLLEGDLFENILKLSDNSLDSIILVDHVHYFKYNLLFALIEEAKRVLKDGGKLIISTYDVSKTGVRERIFDPRIENLIHPELMKFMFEYNEFKHYTVLENNYESLKDYYVISATK